jgi:hypothetical protein
MRTYTSQLKAWPGEFSLPAGDDFTGAHWKAWRKAAEMPLREGYSNIHFYGYSGLDLIKQYGNWKIERVVGTKKEEVEKNGKATTVEIPIIEPLPLSEVMGWEYNPDEEKTKLIAWIGVEFKYYINGIIDPKE